MNSRAYLFTDASFYEEMSAGAFVYINRANIIDCKSFEFRKCDLLKKNNHYAEFSSLIQGVKHHRLYSQGKLIVYTDSEAAIHLFKNLNKQISNFYNINQITNKDNIILKHVKAHTNNTDIKSLLNEWCDKASKDINVANGAFDNRVDKSNLDLSFNKLKEVCNMDDLDELNLIKMINDYNIKYNKI